MHASSANFSRKSLGPDAVTFYPHNPPNRQPFYANWPEVFNFISVCFYSRRSFFSWCKCTLNYSATTFANTRKDAKREPWKRDKSLWKITAFLCVAKLGWSGNDSWLPLELLIREMKRIKHLSTVLFSGLAIRGDWPWSRNGFNCTAGLAVARLVITIPVNDNTLRKNYPTTHRASKGRRR